jgi:Ran GTPase-activating protein 1
MSTIFSLQGKGLKLNSRADIEPWLNGIDPTVIEEIHFGGNTLGVDASVALGEFLKKATKLKVSISSGFKCCCCSRLME